MSAVTTQYNFNIVNYDYYMQDVDDYNYYGIRKLKFPVIRLYGSISGQQCCVFVHGYFPYFYFRPESDEDAIFQDIKTIEKYVCACVL